MIYLWPASTFNTTLSWQASKDAAACEQGVDTAAAHVCPLHISVHNYN